MSILRETLSERLSFKWELLRRRWCCWWEKLSFKLEKLPFKWEKLSFKWELLRRCWCCLWAATRAGGGAVGDQRLAEADVRRPAQHGNQRSCHRCHSYRQNHLHLGIDSFTLLASLWSDALGVTVYRITNPIHPIPSNPSHPEIALRVLNCSI